MPIVPPRLDDRSFDDLVDELVARIPAHAPEWTHARPGDPGRALLELFAWLTDTLLYRANLIPERQRLAFLRLLGVQMRPAVPASGLVGLSFDDVTTTTAATLRPGAALKANMPFETRSELTVLPVAAEAFCKRYITQAERDSLRGVLSGLHRVYNLPAEPAPAFYVTTPVFPGGAADPRGVDVISAVDQCLWIALFAPKKELVGAVRQDLSEGADGQPRAISVGVAPAVEVPALSEDIGPRARIPHVWEMTEPDEDGEPAFHPLSVIADTTRGLTARGVVRLLLPGKGKIGASPNDVRAALAAGVGDRPPRLDDPERAARLVAWLRLRPTERLQRLALTWVGVNAVEIDQRRTVLGRVVGQSDGAANQEISVAATSIERETFQLEVEEPQAGYQPWRLIDNVALAERGAPAASLDTEAGVLRFGDGVRGRVPAAGSRVRVARMRVGGGSAGNLPPGSLKEVASVASIDGKPVGRLKVTQSLPTLGGQDAETLAEAEQRIPAALRHQNRAVTADDYRRVAAETPGVMIGRVDVIPRFLPQQRRDDVPGAVSVMVLPWKAIWRPPNPRPDRPFLEAIHAHLDDRRPLATELYVIGCEYVRLGVGVGIRVRDGFGREAVMNDVRDALYRHLWPLPPGGSTGTGWPRGRSVRDREIEVAVAQVPGVDEIVGVSLFTAPDSVVTAPAPAPGATFAASSAGLSARAAAAYASGGRAAPRELASTGGPAPTSAEASVALRPRWARIEPRGSQAAELTLRLWQLPELTAVVIDADGNVPADLRGAPAVPGETGVAVPVVPEVC
ncbi:putative baseplate assembly protein [Sorangium sp. So ce388]|uniref:putative baseplate assembly protein n=1 Tax=Sorangium sp. So ce388 TaxID=3133309 RepID=UPI003F5C7F2F